MAAVCPSPIAPVAVACLDSAEAGNNAVAGRGRRLSSLGVPFHALRTPTVRRDAPRRLAYRTAKHS